MPCYYPLRGYRSRTVNSSGKRSLTFNRGQGYVDLPHVDIPCGQCIGCRLEKSRQWAIRITHEAKCFENNCFLTLTYAPENRPKNGSLNVKHFQDFMKKLRVIAEDPDRDGHDQIVTSGTGIRFFHCGEYGETNGHPHYHACMFNLAFKDMEYKKTINGNPVYTSKTLGKIWGHGFCLIGSVTFESAAYVARYIMKKVTGKNAVDHYNTINYETGEILSERKPEYTTMSRRPGIGKTWFEKFKTDVYPNDFVLLRRPTGNVRVKPPKYYNAQYEMAYPSDYEKIKTRRLRAGKKFAQHNTHDRLMVRQEIQMQKLKQLKRNKI